MLFADIKVDGRLIIRATEPIEEFALRQWEKEYKERKAFLVVETGKAFDIGEYIQAIGKDIVEFKKWYSGQQSKACSPELENLINEQKNGTGI